MDKCLHALAGLRTEIESLNSEAKDAERQRDEVLTLNASLESKLLTARSDYDRNERDLNFKIAEQKKKISEQADRIIELQTRLDALLKKDDGALPIG